MSRLVTFLETLLTMVWVGTQGLDGTGRFEEAFCCDKYRLGIVICVHRIPFYNLDSAQERRYLPESFASN